jgi:tetraacyldisaccharide 4'-kinase
VRLEEPAWWYAAGADPRARLLAPIGSAYGALVAARLRLARPAVARRPVICVGNFTVGGSGKTPLALAIAAMLKARGRPPAFLTRGYGGTVRGPHLVDVERDTAGLVGDEPLLLARAATTMVSAQRASGADRIAEITPPGSVIVMDDGLQNPGLAKDLALAIVDARRGLGNGRVFPAGPLRAPLDFQLGLVDGIILNAAPGTRQKAEIAASGLRDRFEGPVIIAETMPDGDTGWLERARVTAFAGIANPDRFFRLLERLGATIVQRVTFPDHHLPTEAEAAALLASARGSDIVLVTTEKDAARLGGLSGALGDLIGAARVLAIRVGFSERDLTRLEALIDGMLKHPGEARLMRDRPPPRRA